MLASISYLSAAENQNQNHLFNIIVTSNHSDLHTIRYNKFEFKIIHSMSTFNETPVVLLIIFAMYNVCTKITHVTCPYIGSRYCICYVWYIMYTSYTNTSAN